MTLLGLVTAGIIATGCQPDFYRINGIAQEISDGDTLLLSTDFRHATPSDTIIVNNGHFIYQAHTDSTRISMIYLKHAPQICTIFFAEPNEDITIELTQDPKRCRVSGSVVNNAYQLMADKIQTYNEQISKTIEQAYAKPQLTIRQQKALLAEVKRLDTAIQQTIIETAEQNLDNELGLFLINNYINPEMLPDDRREELINMMPTHMRQRAIIPKK